MADGAAYQIDIQAQAMGVDATAAQVNTLADALAAAEKVATPFDNALASASAQLAQAQQASAAAAESLSAAERKFGALEREATKAGKAVERYAAKGTGDIAGLSALMAQSQMAQRAVLQQAAAVDKAKASATSAAAAEKKLADSMKTLEGAAKKSAAAHQAAGKAGQFSATGFKDSMMASQGLMASSSPMLGRLGQLYEGLGKGGVAGVAVMAATAMIALAGAFIGAAAAAAKYAIAGDKIAKQRLDKIVSQTTKNFAALFSKIDTKPLLNAMERMGNMLSTNTAAGHALQTLISTIMNPLIRAIEYLEPYAHELWNGMVLGALKVAIMVVRARNAIMRMIPESVKSAIKEFAARFDGLSAALSAGQVIFYVIAAVVGVLAVAFLSVAATIAVVVGFFGALVAAAIWVVSAIWDMFSAVGSALGAAWDAVSDWASGAIDAAADFVQGLVQGIKDGVGAVADAAASLAQGAVDAVKGALGISSPSKIMMAMGGYTAEGFEGGIEGGTGGVRRAVEGMVTGGVTGPTGAAVTNNTSSTGGNTYHVTIMAPTGDGQDIRSVFEAWLTGTLDATALQIGGGEVPA